VGILKHDAKKARSGASRDQLDPFRVDARGRPSPPARRADCRRPESLRAASGPSLLEDFALIEKISTSTTSDPERVVHARGSGAHGYSKSTSRWPADRAAFLNDPP